jgi:uncharacterized protein
LDSNDIWTALALVLVIEGMLPFASPDAWRRGVARILKLSDHQIRFFGLSIMLVGLLALLLVW